MARGMRTPTSISQQWNCPAEYLLSTAHGIGSSSGMPASDNSSMVSSTNDYPSQAVVGGNEQVQPDNQRNEGQFRWGWGVAKALGHFSRFTFKISRRRQASPARKYLGWLKEWPLGIQAFLGYPHPCLDVEGRTHPMLQARHQLTRKYYDRKMSMICMMVNTKSSIRTTSEGQGLTFDRNYFFGRGISK